MDLEHPFKTGLPIIGRSNSFYWFKYFLSHLVLHNILLHILVHDQWILDMFEDMRKEYDSKVCNEHISIGTAIVIFIE